MSKSTSLDDILSDVDEHEESPDHPETMQEAFSEEEDRPAAVKEDPDAEDKASSEPDQSDKTPKNAEESEKDGLPPWMHARLKTAQEKADKERQERERLQAQFDQTQSQLQQFQQWYEQQTGNQPSEQQQMATYLQQLEQNQNQQALQQRIAISKRFASQEFGAEEVNRALAWGKDKADIDPQFNQLLWSDPEPVYRVVEAFRKEQAAAELEKYGGDIDKLVEARMAARQQAHPEPQNSQPEKPAQGAMPSNFATAPNQNKGGRSAQQWSGPTPLSKLLE